MPRYIYTICIDDNSKLSGFSEQTVTGVGITKEDDLLMVLLEQGGYINFNWSRVRWYKRHAMPATTQD